MKTSGNHTRKGPGRFHAGKNNPAGSKLWRKCPMQRPDITKQQGAR